MEYDNLHKDCDTILNLIMKQHGRMYRSDAASEVPKGGNRLHSAIQQLLADGAIIEHPKGSSYFDIQPFGREIQKKGGYEKHIEELIQQKESEKETISLTKEKLKVDLANAKIVYKTYPLTRVLAWIGAATGIVTLLLKLAELIGWLPSRK